MARLCFFTTCMGRLNHLRRTLGRVAGQPGCATVVVDYSCPDRCGEWVEATHPGVRVVRVPGMERFNRSLASNLGLEAVEEEWICFFDCDVEVDPGFAASVLPRLEAGRFYCPDPIRDWALCGTFVCARRDFERVGGFDEILEGWGERDFDLYATLERAGVARDAFPSSLLRHIPHSDRSRVRFHEIKRRHLVQTMNRIYRFVKHDLMDLCGSPLPIEERRALYERIARRTRAAIDDGEPLDLVVEREGVDLTLRYEMSGGGGRGVTRFASLGLRSPLLNAAHRFLKAGVLRRTVDLGNAIHGRQLPFGRRLEREVVR